MPLPPKKYHEMDRVELAINKFASTEKPTRADLNRVRVVAQVESALGVYRAEAQSMTPEELEAEKHCSRRLAKHMSSDGDPRPHELCDAHAIISGAHKYAAELRAVLAWFQRRIDDPVNGCWLPRSTAAISSMPDWLRKAVPHSRIHRKKYYDWLNDEIISMNLIRTDAQLVEALRLVEHRLQSGTYPPRIIESAR